MHALSKKLEYDNGEIQKLHQNVFVERFNFCQSLVNALKAADAPVIDMILWESLNMYKKYDASIARAALLIFSRQLAYFTEEVVTYSLFSNKVSDPEKKIPASLMKCNAIEKSPPTGVPFSNHTTKLHQLVGPKSWLIFHFLNLDGSW
ncbi:hypothetical protein AVEN_142033-1 [Araneus ventricosus]|uniref:Uncharacterized protein n=1 Tax=Araneus ventricosus TaxID=182803 RepID=A0A4Y2LSQ9_ARAVE|nr:hypothetical protein AVEN_142033-1 [Araneus ventricosus]